MSKASKTMKFARFRTVVFSFGTWIIKPVDYLGSDLGFGFVSMLVNLKLSHIYCE